MSLANKSADVCGKKMAILHRALIDVYLPVESVNERIPITQF